MKYKLSQYARLHGVTTRTVWNWIRNGEIQIERTKTNRVIVIDNNEKVDSIYVAVYARVSSAENRDNLERQKQRLLDYCAAKGYNVVKVATEIGSGVNDERQKLEKLLLDKSIKIIVVEHKDRLCRFGMNYIQKLLSLDDRRIEIINADSSDKDDLMKDFAAIITSFCARLYGQRRTKRKTEQLIKELSKDKNEEIEEVNA